MTATTNVPDGNLPVLPGVMWAEYLRTVRSQFAPCQPFSMPVGESQNATAEVSDIPWAAPLDVVGLARMWCTDIRPDGPCSTAVGKVGSICEGICFRRCRDLSDLERPATPIASQVGH
jgi:hypothetical protein